MSSSNLSSILRNSRIAQVPKPKGPLFSPDKKYVPTHQLIENKASTMHRQEWGMKSSIPSRSKSRYLIFDELDTQQRLTSFEAIGQYQWNRIRIQELGVVPERATAGNAFQTSADANAPSNPLFSGFSSRLSARTPLSSFFGLTSKSDAKQWKAAEKKVAALRPAFKKWLQDHHPHLIIHKDQMDPADFRKRAVEFITEIATRSSGAGGSWKVVGNGGLTYGLKGRLQQSPLGIKQNTVVEGRILQTNGMEKSVAAAGFVGNGMLGTNLRKVDYAMGDLVRTARFPFEVKQARLLENGRLLMDMSLIEPKNTARKYGYGAKENKNRTYIFQRGAVNERKISSEESAQQAEELLNILTNFEN
ncbi:FADL271Wp [Eremothecium gossypii FDAG1]|nr:FADL271Wp [Eremothecium gossypii FDAG1]